MPYWKNMLCYNLGKPNVVILTQIKPTDTDYFCGAVLQVILIIMPKLGPRSLTYTAVHDIQPDLNPLKSTSLVTDRMVL